MKFSKIIKQVAKQNGVTPQEVEREIKEAIRIGMTSSDPIVQARWKKYTIGEMSPHLKVPSTILFPHSGTGD